ncbi:MAG TPA: hypothetical protein VKF82_08845 [Candidatus Eremiobacteraceae bacterium]|nr:hypothetical protein [Candidatus Eremiobacteraceae bacterium]
MIVVRRRAAAIASALVLAAITMQLANAHTIEEGRGDYTFGPTVKNLALGAKLEQHVVNAGGAIAIKFAITNFGAPIRIFRIGSVLEYTVTGTGPGGMPIEKDDRGQGFSGSISTGMDLRNGSTYVNPVTDLGMVYDFRTPGRYTFVCETALTLGYEAPIYAILKSNIQTLDVVEAGPTEFTFGPAENNLALAVRLDQHEVDVGEPITATLALKNFGSPYRTGSLIDYALRGTGPDGTWIAQTHEVPFSGSIPPGTNIGTGETLKNTADLSQFYDFHKPGRYTFYFFATLGQQLRSNILTLDVR